MRLNRTGRKFAVFYVAVTLTIFVGLELDRIPLTFVHVLAISRVNAARAQAARSASDAADAYSAPLAPSDSVGFSGGLPGRIAAIAGIDPDDPTRFARQPGEGELNSFVGDGPFPPWTLQRKR